MKNEDTKAFASEPEESVETFLQSQMHDQESTSIPGEAALFPGIPVKTSLKSGLYGYTTMKRWIPNFPLKLRKRPLTPMPSTPLPHMPVPEKISLDRQPLAIPVIPFKYYWEDLRLDVDGRYPLMQASGRIRSLFHNISWIAELTKTETNTYQGKIWYTHGTPFFNYTSVKITTISGFPFGVRQAVVTFYGPLSKRSIILTYRSKYFHQVEFEFDYEKGITPLTSIGTYDHPNHPATLANETLSIDTVFRRAGFDVSNTGAQSEIPSSLAGSNTQWSDNEMHDAMQTYWSKYADKPQWSFWTFFARQHETGHSLGGVMFDDIGAQHRQGTAIFYDSFISDKPSGDPDAAAYVNRMKFWTAVHEMGHAFNLAHSWQKSLGAPYGNPWLPSLADEDEARSFMNYPYNVSGGQSAFFADFEYRFSEQELLFLRHAPSEFVEMGNAAWFENHGFQLADVSSASGLEFSIRVNKDAPSYEFMEPVCIELKLKNISDFPKVINEKTLADAHHLTLVIKKDGQPARLYRPFAQQCFKQNPVALAKGESLYETLFVSAGTGEWYISEPGTYTIQASIKGENEQDLVSNVLRIRVYAPGNFDESKIAQDYFSDEVARILQFDGSTCLTHGNETLRNIVEKFSYTQAACHAGIALATPLSREYKTIQFGSDSNKNTVREKARREIKTIKPKYAEANYLFKQAFGETGTAKKSAAEAFGKNISSLGHIDAGIYVERFAESLRQEGDEKYAQYILTELLKEFTSRNVLGRVCENIKRKISRKG